MKTGKVSGLLAASLKLIAASVEEGIQVMAKICQGVQDGSGMPVEWALSMVDAIFKVKGDIRNCSCYGSMKLHEHGTKVVERVSS